MVSGLRQRKQNLQQHVQIRRRFEIGAAHHMRDPLQRIVNDDGQVIASRHLLAPDDGIPPSRGVGHHLRGAPLHVEARPSERRADGGQRSGHVHAPGMRHAGRQALRDFRSRQPSAGTRIKRPPVRITRGGTAVPWGRAGDLTPGAEARIDEVAPPQGVEDSAVIGEVLGLAPHRLFPDKAEPAQILDDVLPKGGRGAEGVDVFDPQQKAPAPIAGKPRVEERGIGVAEMKAPVRARREAEHGHAHARLPSGQERTGP
jgi:hypothetical protein